MCARSCDSGLNDGTVSIGSHRTSVALLLLGEEAFVAEAVAGVVEADGVAVFEHAVASNAAASSAMRTVRMAEDFTTSDCTPGRMGRYGVMNTEFTFRTPRVDEDLAAATEVFQNWEVAEFGWSGIDEDSLHADWSVSGIDIEGNDLLAVAADGRLAGLMNLHARPPFTDLSVTCPVSAEFLGRGLGTMLLHRSEQRARELVGGADDNAEPSFLRQWTGKNSDASITLLAAHGYTPTRALLTMQMELSGIGAEPAVPDGIVIRTLIPGKEERAYHAAEEEAFANHWGFQPVTFDQFKHYVIDSPKWDPSLAFLALDGQDVAGIMLLQAGTSWDAGLGWFDDLAVRAPWRRRGIARALFMTGIAEMRRRGMPRAGLEVDSQNEHGAVALYESAGMREIDRIVPYEKRLR